MIFESRQLPGVRRQRAKRRWRFGCEIVSGVALRWPLRSREGCYGCESEESKAVSRYACHRTPGKGALVCESFGWESEESKAVSAALATALKEGRFGCESDSEGTYFGLRVGRIQSGVALRLPPHSREGAWL
jgi:hypothetical protein